MIELYQTIEKLNENVPETADVGDGGSVFTPATRAFKRPRLEKIHRAIKKQSPPRKRICLGGGRVSGRSRENLISGLIPRVELAHQLPIVVSPVDSESGATRERRQNSDYDLYETSSRPRHLPPSLAARTTARGPLIQVQEVRRYSEIHAEREAASTQLRASIPAEGAPPAATHEFIPPTPGASPAAAQETFAQTPAFQPIQASSSTQTMSSMLQTFAFDDTRDGYDNDPNSLF